MTSLLQQFGPRAGSLALAGLAAVAGSGCIERGYPLGPGGNVDVRTDVSGALFAADQVDENGDAITPRQEPFETGVTLSMMEGNEPTNGGYVEVRVEPPEALALRTDPDDSQPTPTCFEKDGTFRCIASPEGISRFIAASTADWSGEANLVVLWADQRREEPITILPAGVPETATNFGMVIEGLTGTNRVLATLVSLQCTTVASQGLSGQKWPAGKIRSRKAVVRASAPPAAPTVLENAPVMIDSLSSEAALSFDPACGDLDRKTRVRVLLDKDGQSEPFHLCFSDVGGSVSFAITSGTTTLPNVDLSVDPEPHVLRVSALETEVSVGFPIELFEISAFDVDLTRIPMDVDIFSSNAEVLKLSQTSITLSGEPSDPTILSVLPEAEGSVSLHVLPRLLSEPDCASVEITVLP